jgi:hypothetical protein
MGKMMARNDKCVAWEVKRDGISLYFGKTVISRTSDSFRLFVLTYKSFVW